MVCWCWARISFRRGNCFHRCYQHLSLVLSHAPSWNRGRRCYCGYLWFRDSIPCYRDKRKGTNSSSSANGDNLTQSLAAYLLEWDDGMKAFSGTGVVGESSLYGGYGIEEGGNRV